MVQGRRGLGRWHFGLLWAGGLRCTVRVEQHPWPPPTRGQQHPPQPSVVPTPISVDSAGVQGTRAPGRGRGDGVGAWEEPQRSGSHLPCTNDLLSFVEL